MREFAVYQQSPMLVPRRLQSAVSHAQYLYVLGAYNTTGSRRTRGKCALKTDRNLSHPYLKPCGLSSAVIVEGSLYALGGVGWKNSLDLIQKLS
jgi:hypothetical protein